MHEPHGMVAPKRLIARQVSMVSHALNGNIFEKPIRARSVSVRGLNICLSLADLSFNFPLPRRETCIPD